MLFSTFNMTYKEFINTDITKCNLFFDNSPGSFGSHSISETSLGTSINNELHPYGRDDRESEDFSITEIFQYMRKHTMKSY